MDLFSSLVKADGTSGSTMVESALVMLAFTMHAGRHLRCVSIPVHAPVIDWNGYALQRGGAPCITPQIRRPSPTMFCTGSPPRPPGNGRLRAHVHHGRGDDHGAGSDDYRLKVTLSNYKYTMLTPLVAGSRTGQPITVPSRLVSSNRLHAGRSYRAGRVNQNVEPWPGTDSAHTVPPWRSTIRFTTASPMPEPPYSPGP